MESRKRRANWLPGNSFVRLIQIQIKRWCQNTIHDVSSIDFIHFHQRRGYLGDFMNKFLLYRIGIEVKIRLFSPVWQDASILAYVFVPKSPISGRKVSKSQRNSQIYPHSCNHHFRSYQNARISSKFRKTAKISQFWWFLG